MDATYSLYYMYRLHRDAMQKFFYKARKKTEKYENEKKPLCIWVREIFTSVSSNEGLVWLHVLNTLWLVNKTCYSPSTKPMQDWNWLRLGHSYFSKPFFCYGFYFEFSFSPSYNVNLCYNWPMWLLSQHSSISNCYFTPQFTFLFSSTFSRTLKAWT